MLGRHHGHRALADQIGLASRSRVAAEDYGAAPGHPFPESPDGCRAFRRRPIKDGIEPNPIVVARGWAGAILALAVLSTLRDSNETLLASAAGVTPVTEFAFAGRSDHT